MKDKKLLIIRFVVGIIFILSAISKLKSPGLFEIILIDQGFASDRMTAAYLSRILISLELFIGISFFQPFLLKRLIAPLTLFSLLSFSIYLVYLMVFVGNNENCGCFGEVIKMAPLGSLIKNIFLIVIVFYLFRKLESRTERWLIPVTLALVSFLYVFTAFPIRSLGNNAFVKYTHFEQQGLVDLTQGERLVVVMDVNCEHCQAVAQELGELDSSTNNLPPIYIFFYGEDQGANSIQNFFYQTSTNYPYVKISEDEFFDLIGTSPPRIYWLQNGEVNAQWDEDFIENLISTFIIE